MDRNNILVLLPFIYFCSFIDSSVSQLNTCTAAQQCVDLKDCPAINNLVQARPIPQDVVDLLRRSHCGFTGKLPKVCCERTGGGTGGNGGNNLLPNQKICGIQIDDRIIGGEETGIRQYPWMALLEYQKPTKKGFSCGGSLINNRYILTAAHCLKRTPKTWRLISVRLGEHDLSKPVDCDTENPEPGFDECNDPQDIGIEEQIVHEKYDPDDKNQPYDIALLRLNRPVEYTDFIAPVCLPLSEDLKRQQYIGTPLTVVGWGRTENRSQSEVKLRVDVPVRTNKDCEPIYKKSGVTLVSSQICAGGVKAKDSCSGDSGGPLMIKVETNYIAHGIVSFGPTRCGVENFPGIYTRVADYVDWIQQNMKP